MRNVSASLITKKIEELFLRAGTVVRPDILKGVKEILKQEKNKLAREMLQLIIKNAAIAKKKQLPICQDTGLPIIFAEIGQEVVVKGNLKKAIMKGAKAAYDKYGFRQSVVNDPLLRKPPFKSNPALIHLDVIKGNKIKLTVMAKGFGSENKTKLKMFNPTIALGDIEKFIIESVKSAGADACPPYIIGVGIGGAAETANLLAKKALLLPVTSRSKEKHLALMEKRLWKKINNLNIGVMGLGGKGTCLQVRILVHPTHIAGLPVAVNIGCHATRSASCII
jgi:fumarate hydratase subunit alpha